MNAYMNRMLGAGIAIVAGWSANAHATNWCPTASDYTIYCNGCTRTLTCSPSVGIRIVGNNVTLDGNGNTIWSPSDYGVLVTGNSPDISNLVVHLPQNHGILIDNDLHTGFSNIINVTVNFSNYQGLRHSDGGSVQVSGSTFYGNSHSGLILGNNSGYAGTYASTIQSNKLSGPGQFTVTSVESYTTDNNYWYNKNDGLFEAGTNSGMVGYNYFYGNTISGFRSWNSGPALRVYGNRGWQSNPDCNGLGAEHLDVDANSWTTNSGCIDK